MQSTSVRSMMVNSLIGYSLFTLLTSTAAAADIGTAFTYQGRLVKDGTAVSNTCTFTFGLHSDVAAVSHVGSSPLAPMMVAVTEGLFTVQLDFGAAAINGQARWLEIAVQCPGDGGPTTLTPRQELKPAPHALALPGLYTQQNVTSPNLIGGFSGNTVTAGAVGATIAGGGHTDDGDAYPDNNRVTDDFGTIGGGRGNQAGDDAGSADGRWATVGGGEINTATGNISSVGGGRFNMASAYASTVGGGEGNTASDHYSTVGGGEFNTASDDRSTIAGGGSNMASNDYSTVGGGYTNTASDLYSTVCGGGINTASGNGSTVGGGDHNLATSSYSTVGGGQQNTASTGAYNTVGGGYGNVAGGETCTIGGGGYNAASGDASTVPGGAYNQAGGYFSFAAGFRAIVRDAATVGNDTGDEGTFIWADKTDADFTSTGPNQFLVRASGGTTIYSNGTLTAGVSLAAGGGAWAAVSDRNLKENFDDVDKVELVRRLAEIPIGTWSYKSQDPSIRHIGPMGQDFHAAFGVGEDDKHITTIDADGVALAAIQGLHQIVQENERALQEKACEIAELREQMAKLEAMVKSLALQNEGAAP